MSQSPHTYLNPAAHKTLMARKELNLGPRGSVSFSVFGSVV
ncbi:hypothetical protein JD76_05335 [Micromonospora endolithica]|nr:hypothetical protein JD76_05335 [Micromonospora endolithica]